LTDWSIGWKKANWERAIKNKDLFQDIVKLSEEHQGKIYIRYVPAHRGEPGNECADKLARMGSSGP